MQTTLSHQLASHLPQHTDFLIGLSGGVDSVALLHLMSRCPHLNLRVVHIHHGLSPNADRWAEFCRHYCESLGVPFELRKVVVTGDYGLEANARNARYQAVSELIRPNEIFVTAHHLDDQAETFLLALKRGSGIQGLAAMQAVGFWQNFTIFRPLLSLSKAELLAYAKQNNLTWINDESNADDRYDRNFLRHRILPLLNQRFPAFNEMVARSARHCAEQQQLIEELLQEELAARIGKRQQLDVSGFELLSPLKQQQLVRLWLAKCGTPMSNQARLQAVISELIFAKADRNPQVEWNGCQIRRHRNAIFIVPQSEPLDKTSYTISPLDEIRLPQGVLKRSHTELLFCKKSGETDRLPLPPTLQQAPLTVFFHTSGKVKQYGKPMREEMKKIWQINDVPVWERGNIPLVFYQDQFVGMLNGA